MAYLVDTNVLSELLRPRPNAGTLRWMEAQPEIAVSVITLEEIAFGIERAPSGRRARLQRWFDDFLALPPVVLPVDARVARLAGQLRAARAATGRTVTQADMLVAATAMIDARVLVTRNVRDFEGCGVALLDPFTAR